ncbi:hypothetical protein HDU81_000276 [Chytriomyces hyalinus]|uniref:Small subunit of serine palmitoyltransferase n=1 Tax=Chytriomyces confervae TaxID=246404 RepID=A0A507FIR9_9FUNG|nr:hypothetical protein BJ741DRAFT_606934 [Chytriomyces cf. hyalinus JEL632]KAJ3235644.1 hypothetical protein HDU81_000276 [Chytriomyces hyalinus]TPX76112.1 hypothetical protein CcCBS67573_g02608 [Chytriomyces confervae]KAJ3245673.1 hypothetical protein HDU77_009285 [Chytriomyces hyalinus]KAJ3245934.1 hypothetical protein HDU78_008271 [Chytriomyces hyalinus]
MKTNSLSKWISLKIYQYELTFGLYMLEPWEKIIINTVFVLFFGFFLCRGITLIPDFTSYLLEKGRYYVSMDSM